MLDVWQANIAPGVVVGDMEYTPMNKGFRRLELLS